MELIVQGQTSFILITKVDSLLANEHILSYRVCKRHVALATAGMMYLFVKGTWALATTV